MTEKLAISRLGHRGDGIADMPEGAVYVPYTLPGESVTVERVAGHPDRRHLTDAGAMASRFLKQAAPKSGRGAPAI